MDKEIEHIFKNPVWTYDHETEKAKRTTVDECENVSMLGLYYSAKWCPPCKAFLPQLTQYYDFVNREGKIFEIIYISSDRSDEEWREAIVSHPWLIASRQASIYVNQKLNAGSITLPTLKMFVRTNPQTSEQRPSLAYMPQFDWKKFISSRIWRTKNLTPAMISRYTLPDES